MRWPRQQTHYFTFAVNHFGPTETRGVVRGAAVTNFSALNPTLAGALIAGWAQDATAVAKFMVVH